MASLRGWLIAPCRLASLRPRVVLNDFERGVPSGQSLAVRTLGGPNDLRPQLAGRVEVIIVQFELDVLIVVEPGSLGRFP